ALQAADAGMEVTISTGDKDFAQLVRSSGDARSGSGGSVALVNTMSGSRMDSDEAVMAKFGVRAAQIVDLLALMGDTVDNVVGVAKCGPKTAAKWLAAHGTLDGVIAAAPGIKGKIGDNLRDALERLPLNRDLVTIKTDVPLDGGPETLALRERDADRLRELFTRYAMNQALRELDGGAAAAPAAQAGKSARAASFVTAPPSDVAPDPALSAPGEYEMVTGRAQLDAWIERLRAADEFAVDTETDSLDAMRANLVGMSLCIEPGTACY